MNEDLEKQLMQDPEVVEFLKGAILEKANRHDSLSEIISKCSDEKIDDMLNKPVIEDDITLFVGRFEAEIEIKRLERDLSNMCFSLNRDKTDRQVTTQWEAAYEYATQQINIEDAISQLTGEEKLKRNIRCPFHEDGTASLKIYTKNNRFVCFGCNIRGSPIDFVMKFKNCSFQEAVLYLSNH